MTAPGDHWATAYIGTPWVAGESDCWHFARRVWRERFGIEVPEIGWDGSPQEQLRRFRGAEERRLWMSMPVGHEAEGDAVLMARAREPSHIGIWLDLGGVLHSVERLGAIYTPRARLRDAGFWICDIYRRRP